MTNSPPITSADRLAAPARRRTLPPRGASALWLAVALIVGWALFAGGYLSTVVAFGLIYAVFVSGLNIFMGLTAQVSFGQNAFAAIGGYATAYLTTVHDWPPLAACLAGVALSLAVALVVGLPTLRLKGHYLAMATLAIGLIANGIAVEWTDVTQGYMGISGIPPMSLGPFAATSDAQILLTLFAIVLVVALAVNRIRRSRLGRALSAVAGSEDAATALGIDVARTKLMAFLLAAALASLSGSLFAHVVGYISPEVFDLHMVILAFAMIYIGGIGTVSGPVIGALIVILLPELFRSLQTSEDLAYGLALILILIYAPKGLAGLAAGLDARMAARAKR